MSLNSFLPTNDEGQVTPGAQREAELWAGDNRYYSQILRAAQSAEPLPEDTFYANLITMSAAKFTLNYLKENPTALDENPEWLKTRRLSFATPEKLCLFARSLGWPDDADLIIRNLGYDPNSMADEPTPAAVAAFGLGTISDVVLHLRADECTPAASGEHNALENDNAPAANESTPANENTPANTSFDVTRAQYALPKKQVAAASLAHSATPKQVGAASPAPAPTPKQAANGHDAQGKHVSLEEICAAADWLLDYKKQNSNALGTDCDWTNVVLLPFAHRAACYPEQKEQLRAYLHQILQGHPAYDRNEVAEKFSNLSNHAFEHKRPRTIGSFLKFVRELGWLGHPKIEFRDFQKNKPCASLANAVIAIRALGIKVSHDLFHHRINVTYNGDSKTIQEGLLTDDTASAI